jgi:hypothetical protein
VRGEHAGVDVGDDEAAGTRRDGPGADRVDGRHQRRVGRLQVPLAGGQRGAGAGRQQRVVGQGQRLPALVGDGVFDVGVLGQPGRQRGGRERPVAPDDLAARVDHAAVAQAQTMAAGQRRGLLRAAVAPLAGGAHQRPQGLELDDDAGAIGVLRGGGLRGQGGQHERHQGDQGNRRQQQCQAEARG